MGGLGQKEDFIMQTYEFVPKSEYQPVRIELEKIIKKVQDIVRENFTFQFRLVGGGGRHLITRIKGANCIKVGRCCHLLKSQYLKAFFIC